ncbi:unnamed protein product [Oppiella nova]|uniref:NR LBD domain-containing protein n=1 Tax=Oppiella nova TaxID=334625 RepID=A0A7R9QZ37_9ACAR|nr:unnamed protein product [Oppiella nova]CAG2180794.1 unnamed protein product [Oppiella nova]
MRSVPNYDCIHDNWTFVMDNENSITVNVELMRYFRRNVNHWFKIFFHSICPQLDNDPIVLNLLTAIILFTPNRPNLIHHEAVILQQQIYTYLLKRYLLLRYGRDSESEDKLRKLLDTLPALKEVSDRHRKNCEETDPEVVPFRLLRELFDLKSRGDKQGDRDHNIHHNLLVN